MEIRWALPTKLLLEADKEEEKNCQGSCAAKIRTARGIPPVGSFKISPNTQNTAVVKAGDFLLLLNDDAKLTVARSSRSQLEVIQRYTVGESATWAQPAVSGNRVFIKDVSSLGLWTLE